jgi:hypothetical protein
MAGNSSVEKLQPPALPVPADSSVRGYLSDLNNILRLFFNRTSNNINLVTGADGGRFIDSPNGFFFDNADQAIATINVAQPVRFNQTYLNNAVTIDAATTLKITATYSGVYSVQFTGQARSSTAGAKVLLVWLNLNGTSVGYSTREYTVVGSGVALALSWNFNIVILAGQYIQIMLAADSVDVRLDAVAATSPHPGIASAALAVTFVSILPDPVPTTP